MAPKKISEIGNVQPGKYYSVRQLRPENSGSLRKGLTAQLECLKSSESKETSAPEKAPLFALKGDLRASDWLGRK